MALHLRQRAEPYAEKIRVRLPRLPEPTGPQLAFHVLPHEGFVVHFQLTPDYDVALHTVDQFSHIARPAVTAQKLQRLSAKGLRRAVHP